LQLLTLLSTPASPISEHHIHRHFSLSLAANDCLRELAPHLLASSKRDEGSSSLPAKSGLEEEYLAANSAPLGFWKRSSPLLCLVLCTWAVVASRLS